MIKLETNEYIRVGKKDARKYYKSGFKVFVLPCNVGLNSSWISPTILPKSRDFDNIMNEYMYYNCNSELGYYPSFFISRKEFEHNE